jgi:hypothetical protein
MRNLIIFRGSNLIKKKERYMARTTHVTDSFELHALLEDLGMGGHRLGVDQASVASLRRLVGFHISSDRVCQTYYITDEEKDKLVEWLAQGSPEVACSLRRRCPGCKCSEETINKRGHRPDGPQVGDRTMEGLIDFIDERDSDNRCRSCIVSPQGDGISHLICGGCGFSETLSQICMLGTFYDRWTRQPDPGQLPGGIRCPTCRDAIAAGRLHEPRVGLFVRYLSVGSRHDISDSEEDDIYLSDSEEDGGLVLARDDLDLSDSGEQENNEENVALEEALGRVDSVIDPTRPGRHGDHIDRIECLETICGIVVLDAQNDRLMERLRAVVNILGIDVPGIYSLGDEEDPYDGELDLEEETEDNTEEKAVSVKKTVQEMGELLFDIKDKISEGEYLKLMNGLQSITNEMNH